MIRLFLKDSFIYTLSTFLTRGIGLLMLPIYTSFFGPEEFGVLDMLLVSGTILGIVIGLEVHQAVARFFPEVEGLKQKRDVVSTGFWFLVFFFLLFFIPAYTFSPQLSHSLSGSFEYTTVIRIALVSYGCNFVYFYTSSQLRWQLKVKESLFVSIIYSALAAGLAFGLLKYFSFMIEGVFIAQICAALTCTALSVVLTREYYFFRANIPLLIQLLSFSVPLVFSSLIVYAMLYVDRFMITYFLSINDLGLYGFAYRIASAVGLLAVGCQTALTPLVYNKFKDPETPGQIAKIFRYFLLATSLILLVLFTFSHEIVLLIGSADYVAASPLIPWIAIAILFTGITSFTPGIFIKKKTRWILYINITSFSLNLALCYFLIPAWGLIGSVYATALSSFAYFSMYYFIGQRYYFIPLLNIRKQRF